MVVLFSVCGLQARDEVPEPVVVADAGAEEELRGEIAEVYRMAVLQFEAGNFTGARRLFQDCYALYMASAGHLREPEKLETIATECESYLERLKKISKLEGVRGGWRAPLGRLKWEVFAVEDAHLGAAIEYWRKRAAEDLERPVPNMVWKVGRGDLERRVTLEYKNVSALDVLRELVRRAGGEIHFEREAIVVEPVAETY